jgi:hypothetical protein
MFLLSGDAIVNESMLTGESVPVSKIPVNDSIVSSWKSGGELNAETAKCFLYTGTRVVRVRGGNGVSLTEKEQALAVVVRTGNCRGFTCQPEKFTIFCRFQHNKGIACKIDALPEANRIQVLQRLAKVHWIPCWYGDPWIPG